MEHHSIRPPDDCLLCDNKAFTNVFSLDDYFLTGEHFSLFRCNGCGLIHTTPRPEPSSLHAYYASDEYISHSAKNTSLMGKVYLGVRKYTHARKFRLVSRLAKGSTILDIGCATGEFLKYCASKGMSVTGIEPNAKARNYAVLQHRLDVKDEHELESLKTGSFDIVTMWHVLEHVPDLNQRMSALHRLLKDEGTAIFALPNHSSYDALHYGKYWAAWDVPRHLYHFNQNAFRLLAEKHRFRVTEVLPMRFDAFYVSLLSEKYRNGKPSLSNAFFTGLKSNLKAAASNKEYSSLIYVIKKSGNI